MFNTTMYAAPGRLVNARARDRSATEALQE